MEMFSDSGKKSQDHSIYLQGKKLFGDDFAIAKIEEWFEDEKEGYAELGAKTMKKYKYVYHELNAYHGFRHLKQIRIKKALGLGSAYGDEFFPIVDKISDLTILDPSDSFSDVKEIKGVSSRYVKPNVTGDMPFESGQFDLITSFGVLHHIPNVSHVLKESYRCLSKGGTMLIREPIISMGDWSKPRVGLTKRERGIPLNIFKQIIIDSGFGIEKFSTCIFPAIPILLNKLSLSAYNSKLATRIDSLLCKLFFKNYRYHATKATEKLRPVAAFFVLTKKG